MTFVCDECKEQRHHQCRGGTWCDVNHEARRRRDERLLR